MLDWDEAAEVAFRYVAPGDDLFGPLPGPDGLCAFHILAETLPLGAGPIVVDRKTGEARQCGSLIKEWPEWLQKGPFPGPDD